MPSIWPPSCTAWPAHSLWGHRYPHAAGGLQEHSGRLGREPDGKRGTPLMGDIAARILDLAALSSTAIRSPAIEVPRPPAASAWHPLDHPTRLPRARDRDPGRDHCPCAQGLRPYAYAGRHGPVYRAKIDFDLLEQAKWDVVGLACCADLSPDYSPSGYPHHYFMHKQTTTWAASGMSSRSRRPCPWFCNVAMSNDVYALRPSECQPTWILEPDGRLMSAGCSSGRRGDNALPSTCPQSERIPRGSLAARSVGRLCSCGRRRSLCGDPGRS